MPAKNSIKTYIANGYYHIYNRGVEKRRIFENEFDYSVFLSYLKEYLLPKNEERLRNIIDSDSSSKEKDKAVKLLRMNNFSQEIDLLAFCLMPNHFHFLIKQGKEESMDKFMNSLCTRHSMYFNKKYKRVGSLFQGVYKAILIENEEYLLHLSRYIHFQAEKDRVIRPSSFNAYISANNVEWVDRDLVLSYFSKTNPSLSYKSFVFQSTLDSFGNISKLLLD